MDKFDRSAQRQLLQILYDAHPYEISDDALQSVRDAFGDDNVLISNLSRRAWLD